MSPGLAPPPFDPTTPHQPRSPDSRPSSMPCVPLSLSPRDQQLYAATLEVAAGVRPVLLSSAPPSTREAGEAVLACRNVLSHWEAEFGASKHSRSNNSTPSSDHSGQDLSTPTLNASLPCAPAISALAPPLLTAARDSMDALLTVDQRREGAPSYTRVIHYLITQSCPMGTRCDLGPTSLSLRVKSILGYDRLLSTTADIVIGLDPESIEIVAGQSKPLFDGGARSFLYASSISDLAVNLNDSPSSAWFPWIVCTIRPLHADIGSAQLENATNMRVALGVIVRLCKLAREDDPKSIAPSRPVFKRVFGLVTAGTVWRLYLMVAEDDTFPVTELWCGSALVPSDMVQFLSLISYLTSEGDIRREWIGNMLYCIRSRSSLVDDVAFVLGSSSGPSTIAKGKRRASPLPPTPPKGWVRPPVASTNVVADTDAAAAPDPSSWICQRIPAVSRMKRRSHILSPYPSQTSKPAGTNVDDKDDARQAGGRARGRSSSLSSASTLSDYEFGTVYTLCRV